MSAVADELGAGSYVCPADLHDPAAPDALVAAAEAAAGPLDILVNNAGLTRDMLALRMKDTAWQEVLDVDLTAPFRLARGAMRGMLRRRFGRVIGIASVVATSGNPGQANYAAAKAGMVAMSKAMAQEVGTRGITVNIVSPGYVGSAMTEALAEEQKARLLQMIPTGRMGTPDDVAGAVVYLASNEAAWVTGATLHVNGGMLMV